MRKYISNILLLTTISLSSCNDYLDVKSPSSFDSDYLFSSTVGTNQMLLGAYQAFTEDAYTSRMSCVFMQNTDVEANSGIKKNEWKGDRTNVYALEGSILQNWSDIKNAWVNSYRAIDRANQCIQGIEASALYKEGNAEMKQYLGEAYCLRAYWYWMLCNYWGDVPYTDIPSTADKDNNTPRVNKNEIYTACIQDLIDHYEDMKWASDVSTERMNRDFALGMIARLSLFRAGYSMQEDGTMQRADDYRDYLELAKQYAGILIESKKHTLETDYAYIFKRQSKLETSPSNGDMIYEVAFAPNVCGDVGWCIGRSAKGSYGTGGSYICFTAPYFYSFDPKDLRRDATCDIVQYRTEKVEEPTGIGSIMPVKWCRLWLPSSPGANSSKKTGINWPVMRYSDVLLMYAEAENALNGPTDDAKEKLRLVRQRAFKSSDYLEKVTNYINDLTSPTQFFDAIVNERAWEFGGECLRKFDLVRWNLYGEKITKVKNDMLNMGKAAVGMDIDQPDVAQYRSLPDKLYYTLVKGISSVTGQSATILQLKNDYYTRLSETEVTKLSMVDKYDKLKEGDNKYVAFDWTASFMKKVKNEEGKDQKDEFGNLVYEPADIISTLYRGYTGNGSEPVPYLLPIPNDIIVASKGVLSNKGYGLTK